MKENDVIPIVVLRRTGSFQKEMNKSTFNAREFTRELDLISDKNLFKKGLHWATGKGRLFIIAGSEYPTMKLVKYSPITADHPGYWPIPTCWARIKGMKTILVSKDINLRMKALSLGILAEDYINDKVTMDKMYSKKATKCMRMSAPNWLIECTAARWNSTRRIWILIGCGTTGMLYSQKQPFQSIPGSRTYLRPIK